MLIALVPASYCSWRVHICQKLAPAGKNSTDISAGSATFPISTLKYSMYSKYSKYFHVIGCLVYGDPLRRQHCSPYQVSLGLPKVRPSATSGLNRNCNPCVLLLHWGKNVVMSKPSSILANTWVEFPSIIWPAVLLYILALLGPLSSSYQLERGTPGGLSWSKSHLNQFHSLTLFFF